MQAGTCRDAISVGKKRFYEIKFGVMPGRRWRKCGPMILLAATACQAPKPALSSARSGADSAFASPEAPVLTDASVVAFWLSAADTVPDTERAEARELFRRSNALVARYLDDTDIALVATVNDTVVVALAGGKRRVLTLVGLDFPYGYVLVEPGYAEEYHTGVPEAADLEAAIDDYFGLDDPSPSPRHRIAQRGSRDPAALLDILSCGREGSALRTRNLDARVSPAAFWRRGCARCAWLRRDPRRGAGASARLLPRSR